MISTDRNLMYDAIQKLNKKYASGIVGIIDFEDFLRTVLTKQFNEAVANGDLKFPIEARIAPSISELNAENYEPSRIIRLEEPLRFKGIPIWWGKAAEAVDLMCGYINGDSRKPCRLAFDDNTKHGFLGGITGFGKSVTLNDIIFFIAMKYPPWEVNLVLLDAKGADIKRFGKFPLPHILSLGATTDTDYIVSLLEEQQRRMTQLQAALSKVGSGKLKDFMKKTHLVVPVTIIIGDEIQTLYKNAGKDVDKINSIFDAYARLGRSTRFHLFCASQEVGNTMPEATMNQFQIRCCLGATPEVSTQIIGNDAAGDINNKGILISNCKHSDKNPANNIMYRVPYQSDDEFEAEAEALWEVGKKLDFCYSMSNYDDTIIIREKDYPNYLAKYPADKDVIYLGEPAFIMREEIQLVKIRFDRKAFENVAIIHPNVKTIKRCIKMLYYNIARIKANNFVLSGDNDIVNSVDFNAIGARVSNCESHKDSQLNMLILSVIYRKIMLTADEYVRMGLRSHELTDGILEEFAKGDSRKITDLNKARAFYILKLIDNEYNKELGIDDIMGKEKQNDARFNHVKGILNMYYGYGCGDKLIEASDFPLTYVWLIQFNNMKGIGLDPDRKFPEKFKNVLFRSCQVNMRFILTATNIEEAGEYLKACKYGLIEGQETRFVNKFGGSAVDCYPKLTTPTTGVLMNKTEGTCSKFKKMFFDDEISQ